MKSFVKDPLANFIEPKPNKHTIRSLPKCDPIGTIDKKGVCNR